MWNLYSWKIKLYCFVLEVEEKKARFNFDATIYYLWIRGKLIFANKM